MNIDNSVLDTLLAKGFTQKQVESATREVLRRKAYEREYRHDHKGDREAYMSTYNKSYRLDPTHLEREKEARKEHTESNETASVRWRRLHPNRARGIRSAATERWRRNHPDAYRAYKRNQNAAQKGAEGTFTIEEWESKLSEFDSRCAYCGAQAVDTPEGRLTPDHVVPIARGGGNTISNIVPACSLCNHKKGVKAADEFRAHLAITTRCEVE